MPGMNPIDSLATLGSVDTEEAVREAARRLVSRQPDGEELMQALGL